MHTPHNKGESADLRLQLLEWCSKPNQSYAWHDIMFSPASLLLTFNAWNALQTTGMRM